MAVRSVTGDSPKSIVTQAVSLATLAIVAEADLKKADHPINISAYSGKQAGSVVAVKMTAGGAYQLAMAQGSDPAAAWVIFAPAAAGG